MLSTSNRSNRSSNKRTTRRSIFFDPAKSNQDDNNESRSSLKISTSSSSSSFQQYQSDDPPTPLLLQQEFENSFNNSGKFLNSSRGGGSGGQNDDSLEPVVDETPLLEELGINFTDIFRKSKFVLNPFSRVKRSIFRDQKFSEEQYQQHNPELEVLKDGDLCGPLVFCLLLGFVLLCRGKLHFGTIYGVGTVGCLSIYLLLNLMSRRGIEIQTTISILGYGLLPMVFLALLRTVLPMISMSEFTSAWILSIFTWAVVLWSTWSATSMIVYSMMMIRQKYLIAYPVLLVYVAFALIVVHG